jgi:hypothetical protein
MKGHFKLLKDVDGNEINIGDIIQVGDPVPLTGKDTASKLPKLQKGNTYTVFFNDGCFVFKTKKNGSRKRRLYGAVILANGFKIVEKLVS